MSDLANFVLFVIISRYFGPDGVGKYSYGFAIAGITSAFIGLGLDEYAIRECVRMLPKERSHILGKLVSIQLGILLPVLLGLLLYSFLTSSSTELLSITFILLGFHLMLSFTKMLFVPAFSEQSMRAPALTDVIGRVIAIGFVILLVIKFQSSLPTALLPFLLGGFIMLSVSLVSFKRYLGKLRIGGTFQDISFVLKSVWPFSVSLIIYFLYARVDLVMLTLICDAETAGIYAASVKFLEIGIMPVFFLGLAVYPLLSKEIKNDFQNFNRTTDNFLRITLLLGGLLTWMLFFVIPMFLTFLLGEKFAQAIPVIRIMSGLGLLAAFDTVGYRLLLAADFQVTRVKIQLYGTLLNIFLNLFLIPRFSISGAILATYISQIVIIVYHYYIVLFNSIVSKEFIKTVVKYFLTLLLSISFSIFVVWMFNIGWMSAMVYLLIFCFGIVINGFLKIPRKMGSVVYN